MPSGAKKRKALKKKKEQEALGGSPSNKGFNGHGYDGHGSQDEGESDGNLSSPGSQGNGEVWTRDPSPSPLSGLKKDTVKERTDLHQGQEAKSENFTAPESGTCHEEKNGVDKPPSLSSENVTHSNGKAASIEASGTLEIPPADDSVSKEGNIRGTAEETSRESQVPESSEDKSLLPSGPPIARTSWLSCCGLFDVMAGSER
ncbi:Uncharacterized protein HA466_0061030 [Hirschfeldia incana]|nr:Uncharacterized protein HA466_0061030 [Hirschfeldia incana]KAJ0259804.1 Uncharacterized protein HA466_0061030 [Hirschfeldia incana]